MDTLFTLMTIASVLVETDSTSNLGNTSISFSPPMTMEQCKSAQTLIAPDPEDIEYFNITSFCLPIAQTQPKRKK